MEAPNYQVAVENYELLRDISRSKFDSTLTPYLEKARNKIEELLHEKIKADDLSEKLRQFLRDAAVLADIECYMVARPGILQTELVAIASDKFSAEELRSVLYRSDHIGRIKRIKDGATYRLYSV